MGEIDGRLIRIARTFRVVVQESIIKTYSKLLVLIAITAFSNVAAFADTRIRFPKGRASATVTGRVTRGGRVCHFAGAKVGQQFTATVSSPSGKVVIFESSETSYAYEIETRGDQSVRRQSGRSNDLFAHRFNKVASSIYNCGFDHYHRK